MLERKQRWGSICNGLGFVCMLRSMNKPGTDREVCCRAGCTNCKTPSLVKEIWLDCEHELIPAVFSIGLCRSNPLVEPMHRNIHVHELLQESPGQSKPLLLSKPTFHLRKTEALLQIVAASQPSSPVSLLIPLLHLRVECPFSRDFGL